MKKLSKYIVSIFTSSLIFSAVFAERSPVYISPNNDGVQDNLTVPLRIKEKRYVNEWSFRVYNEEGSLVRTIGNKVKLPEKITFKNFFKALVTPKQTVEIPSTIVWNGFFDDGSLAPDGTYFYQFTATDDNGNSATTDKYVVIVDNTAPEISLKELSGNEKNFGEGSKSILKIKQSGSLENLWLGRISDIEGKVIKTFKWENAEPLSFSWDGQDENNVQVPDGVYNYEITSTDFAGNTSEKAQILNIIYSTEKPEISIAISGSKYFSPKGNSPIKTMDLAVTIPSPESKVNALSEWSVEIQNKDGKLVKKYSGTKDAPKDLIKFDGVSDDKKDLPEGEYQAVVKAKYSNGFEPSPVLSPIFVLDNQAPQALVSLPNNKVFNGKEDFIINQAITKTEPEYTGIKNWTGRIIDFNGKIVKQFDFASELPSSIEWNGIDDSGNLAKDGKYFYQLFVSELAGNTASFGDALDSNYVFQLDTSKTELMLSTNPQAFSPNGDGIQDTISFNSVVKATSGIKSYELMIFDSTKNLVKTISGIGNVPSSIKWDGKNEKSIRCVDGNYSAMLKTVANSGTEETAISQIFLIDTVYPEIQVETPYLDFSPELTSSQQNLIVDVKKSSVETKWSAVVSSDKSKKTVKTFNWQNSDIKDFIWDGTDENGNRLENGKYSILISSVDAAGNKGDALISGINLDARPVSAILTNEFSGISPNGDGYLDSQIFEIQLGLKEGISSWNFDVMDLDGNIVKSFSEKDSKNVPKILNWAGETESGDIANGEYFGKVHVEYAKGNTVEAISSVFICTAKEPQLSVGIAPKYFSPDNDGNNDDLFIKLSGKSLASLKNWDFTIYDRNGNQFWKTSGKSTITEKMIWDGRGNNGELVQSAEDYKYVFTATDILGMKGIVEGTINVDVLVVRDGDKLKMQVPSIIFRSDNADFGVQVLDNKGKIVKTGITQSQLENNERVLKRIATILKKFSDYNVTIVGHANSVTGTTEEENEDNPSKWGPALQPLSEKRAQYVKDELVNLGVNVSRLSVEGKGGSEPVADRKNKDVNWKNRRVEFILEK